MIPGSTAADDLAEVSFSANETGLRSLRFGGHEFVGDGAFQVRTVVLENFDGAQSDGGRKPQNRRFVPGQNRLELNYPWGAVVVRYTAERDRLTMVVNVSNTSDAIIRRFAFQLFETRFPSLPKAWRSDQPYYTFNLGSPTTVFAECEASTVCLRNEDINRPLSVGWRESRAGNSRPLVVATESDWMAERLNPMLDRPIYPGLSDEYRVSLRFGPAGTPRRAMAGDLWDRFAKDHPYRLDWKDRRPIGALFLSASDLKAPRNPRGWFIDKNADFLSEQGRQDFQQRLLAYADESVRVLKEMNAQGMIVWDLEGQEYPHAISYLGDPRSLPSEMETVADEFFRKFARAGLRVGVCLRPQVAVCKAYGTKVEQLDTGTPLEILDAKITYARKRWGCTMFYIDSNGDPNVPISAAVFRELAARHPGLLLIPEHESTEYYAVSAPYRCYSNLGQLGTPEPVREIYPDAFSVIAVLHGDPEIHREAFEDAVSQGDILLIHGWFPAGNHASVKEIYDRAAYGKGSSE